MHACLLVGTRIGRNLTASSPGYFWATAPIGPQSWQKAVQKPKIAQAEPMPGWGNRARPPLIGNHPSCYVGQTQILALVGVENLTLSDAGVWRLNLGRGGGRKMPPLPFEALVVLFDRKMVPNLISRRDQDVSTEK